MKMLLKPMGEVLRTPGIVPSETSAPGVRKASPVGLGQTNVVQYRTFRNADPPALVELWNKVFTSRGAVYLRNSSPLERYLFSKPFFDPHGLFLAWDEDRLLGFAHAGIPTKQPGEPSLGTTCILGVHPDYRRQRIGSELLQRSENYLKEHGAKTLFGGSRYPANPFYLGLYGGCDSPGVLETDPLAEPFLLHHGYKNTEKVVVFQKEFEPDQQYKCLDSRMGLLRQNFKLVVTAPHQLDWWQECTLGGVDPMEFSLEDERKKKIVARTLVWEMDSYKYRWGRAAVGIVAFEVDPEYRRKGVGKFLLTAVLREMQQQYVELAEIQISENMPLAIPFLHDMGFQIVDRGKVFVKTI